jgi:ribosomal 30S subunit maturation factor RimM
MLRPHKARRYRRCALPAGKRRLRNSGDREILVPAVPEFIREINVDEGFVTVRLIDGM